MKQKNKYVDPYNTWINLAFEKRIEELYTEDTDESYDKAVIQTCNELKQWKKTFWNDSWKPKYERATKRNTHNVSSWQCANASPSLTSVLNKCRNWIHCIWDDKADIHEEQTMFAIANELKVNGATEEDIHEFCKKMLGDEYNPKETTKRWKYIKGNPLRMNTLNRDLPLHLKIYL